MKINDHIEMKGRLTMRIYSKTGELVSQQTADNDIVRTGRDLVAKQFIGLGGGIAPISHLAVGTGTTPVSPQNDTALGSEIGRVLINPATQLANTPEGRVKVTVTADLDFSIGNGVLTEAGLFNAATAGVMYNRVVFPAVNKTTDFKLTLIWEILF